MNKQRRKKIGNITDKINKIKTELNNIHTELSLISSDEQDTFDNMPENLQGSERGMISEEALDNVRSKERITL